MLFISIHRSEFFESIDEMYGFNSFVLTLMVISLIKEICYNLFASYF